MIIYISGNFTVLTLCKFDLRRSIYLYTYISKSTKLECMWYLISKNSCYYLLNSLTHFELLKNNVRVAMGPFIYFVILVNVLFLFIFLVCKLYFIRNINNKGASFFFLATVIQITKQIKWRKNLLKILTTVVTKKILIIIIIQSTTWYKIWDLICIFYLS